MEDLDEVAHQLEVMTGSPLADAVRGRVRVLAVSEPARRGRFQECRLELLAEATGVVPTTVQTTAVIQRRYWPETDMILPARISRSRPHVLEVDWEYLARPRSSS
ncbi:hypothetical protein [Microbacterium sp. P01]|uniref:hypothetical protein n=1 Tax=unclassified Microbacterium TaxID=2609290 RepID=UPI00366EC409